MWMWKNWTGSSIERKMQAAEQGGLPEAQNHAARAGGTTGAKAKHGENQLRSWNPKTHPLRQLSPRSRPRRGWSWAQCSQRLYRGGKKSPYSTRATQTGRPLPGMPREGRVYRQKEPEKTLIRIVGQAPLKATVFEMERLRCNGCCQMFTAGGSHLASGTG